MSLNNWNSNNLKLVRSYLIFYLWFYILLLNIWVYACVYRFLSIHINNNSSENTSNHRWYVDDDSLIDMKFLYSLITNER